MIPPELLRRIRNDLPMRVTIGLLGDQAPPSKIIEGYFRFLCPECAELNATVNPETNLAHCFCCGRNTNNIDLLVRLGYDFRSAVALLEKWLGRYETQQENRKNHKPLRGRSAGHVVGHAPEAAISEPMVSSFGLGHFGFLYDRLGRGRPGSVSMVRTAVQ